MSINKTLRPILGRGKTSENSKHRKLKLINFQLKTAYSFANTCKAAFGSEGRESRNGPKHAKNKQIIPINLISKISESAPKQKHDRLQALQYNNNIPYLIIFIFTVVVIS